MLDLSADPFLPVDVFINLNPNKGDTDTKDFNRTINGRVSTGGPELLSEIYKILGKVEGSITESSCEAVDCLHPCYGANKLGAC